MLINEHPSRVTGPCLYHVDLYRIDDARTALALGLEDCLYGDGVTVIEWAERARELVPAQRLWISLAYLDYTKRSLLFEASSKHYAGILAALRGQILSHGAQGPA